MNYAQISKETFDWLYKARASLEHSPLNASIRILAELRTSQINGCDYCWRFHSEEAKKLGIPQEKLNTLGDWQAAACFSEEEKAALLYTEAVTHLNAELKNAKESLQKIYSERQLVDLTACIALMNALNRIAISLR
jgi:AhpD family alkylhydroperoxidase